MTKEVSNSAIYYKNRGIMMRKQALFTNSCFAWLNLPLNPLPFIQLGLNFSKSFGPTQEKNKLRLILLFRTWGKLLTYERNNVNDYIYNIHIFRLYHAYE